MQQHVHNELNVYLRANQALVKFDLIYMDPSHIFGAHLVAHIWYTSGAHIREGRKSNVIVLVMVEIWEYMRAHKSRSSQAEEDYIIKVWWCTS